MSGSREGKIITPIRKAMDDKRYKGVKFHCKSPEHAETVRTCAYITGIKRNGYMFKSHRNNCELIIYKEGVDIWAGGKYIHVYFDNHGQYDMLE